MRTPSASSTSALPQVPLAERLPCFATGTPQAATTNEATVEMLNVPAPSPPVPQVSTAPFDRSGTARARMARAKPTTSSSVSPRAAMAARSAPIWAGVASPSMIVPIASAASSSVSRSPRASFARWRLMLTFAPTPRKLRRRSLPDVGEDALGVELHALERPLAVAQAHHDAAVRPRRHLEARGHGLGRDHERVVARGGEDVRQPGEDRLAVVADLGGLAVHELRRAHDLAAERLAEGLVPEADAEERHRRAADELEADPRLVGRPRPRRDHDAVRLQGERVLDAHRVVADDLHLRPELAEVLVEVEGERVVVVDEEDHARLSRDA